MIFKGVSKSIDVGFVLTGSNNSTLFEIQKQLTFDTIKSYHISKENVNIAVAINSADSAKLLFSLQKYFSSEEIINTLSELNDSHDGKHLYSALMIITQELFKFESRSHAEKVLVVFFLEVEDNMIGLKNSLKKAYLKNIKVIPVALGKNPGIKKMVDFLNSENIPADAVKHFIDSVSEHDKNDFVKETLPGICLYMSL